MIPTPGFSPPRFGRLYDIVFQVVLGSPSYVFGTSLGCSWPSPAGSKSLALAIVAFPPVAGGVVLVRGGALLFVPPSPLPWSLFIAPLRRNCAIAITDRSPGVA